MSLIYAFWLGDWLPPAQKRAKKGLLMPDEEVVSCVKKYLEKEEKLRLLSKKRDYLILDGIPRTERQVELLQPFIAVRLVICLYVKDQQVLAQRIAGRAKKQKRVDDQDPMVLKKRLEEYETKTAGIIKKYPSHIVASVAADQPLVKVFQEALQHICKTF